MPYTIKQLRIKNSNQHLPSSIYFIGLQPSNMKITPVLLLVVTLVYCTEAKRSDYKKEYCGKQEFVGNARNKYPHLHCGSSFFTLSWNRGHDNMVDSRGPNCKKAKDLLKNPENWEMAANPGAITNAIQAFYNGECEDLAIIQHLLQLMHLLEE